MEILGALLNLGFVISIGFAFFKGIKVVRGKYFKKNCRKI